MLWTNGAVIQDVPNGTLISDAAAVLCRDATCGARLVPPCRFVRLHGCVLGEGGPWPARFLG